MASRFLYLVRHGAAVSYNDAGHLPPELRWTGFPPGVRPAGG
jgi:probable phosphoglycerate mutase